MPFLAPEYLLPSQWVLLIYFRRIGVHTAPKCGTEPVRYVTLHYRERRGAAQLRFVTETAPP